MTLWKWEDTGNLNKKHEIAVSGERALKEAMDLLQKTGGGAVGDNKDNTICPGKPTCSTFSYG